MEQAQLLASGRNQVLKLAVERVFYITFETVLFAQEAELTWATGGAFFLPLCLKFNEGFFWAEKTGDPCPTQDLLHLKLQNPEAAAFPHEALPCLLSDAPYK